MSTLLKKETIVTYAPRDKVVKGLFNVMRKSLCRRELALLLAYFGYVNGKPENFRELAEHFGYTGGSYARKAVEDAVDTVRRAIPCSPLAGHLCGFEVTDSTEKQVGVGTCL